MQKNITYIIEMIDFFYINKHLYQKIQKKERKNGRKATRECIESNVYGPMSEQTLKHALSKEDYT